jgi:hypothetical protein
VESSWEFGIEPSGSIDAGKLSSGLTTGVLSSSAQLHRFSLVRHKQTVGHRQQGDLRNLEKLLRMHRRTYKQIIFLV